MKYYLCVLTCVLILLPASFRKATIARAASHRPAADAPDFLDPVPLRQTVGCAICKVSGQKWTCATVPAGGYGAPLCIVTSDGQACNLEGGICYVPQGGPGGFGDDDDDDDELLLSKVPHGTPRRLKLNNSSVINEIAAQWPRAGMAVALIEKEGGFARGRSRMYMSPIGLTSEDVQKYTQAAAGAPDGAEEIRERSETTNQQISAGQAAPVIFEIVTHRLSSDRPMVSIRAIQATPSDPPYSELVLNFTRSSTGDMNAPKTVRWKLN